MKVLHILHELKFSGAEIMYVDAASLFQEKGYDLYVLATAERLGEYAPYFEKAGYKVLHKPYPQLKNYGKRILYYIRFIRFLKQEKIAVVHNHSHFTMWGVALCAWIARIRSIYTFHSVFAYGKVSYVYHLFLRWSAKYIFKCIFHSISDSVYDNELQLHYNTTTKIYNWYGSNRYYPAQKDEKNLVRKELDIPLDALVLISVGGCNKNKRHSDIIKALCEIKKKNTNCIYLHLGKGISEPDEMKLVKDLDLEHNVRFCGNKDNVRKYLIASDMYIMSSYYEGLPITTIEALACNIPAILYDVPGLRDFNNTGEHSFLIPEDYNILANKILYVYSHPHEVMPIIANAKQFVDATFFMQTNVNKIIDLYQN